MSQYHVTHCHVIRSRHIVSCHTLSHQSVSSHTMSCHTFPYPMTAAPHVASCLAEWQLRVWHIAQLNMCRSVVCLWRRTCGTWGFTSVPCCTIVRGTRLHVRLYVNDVLYLVYTWGKWRVVSGIHVRLHVSDVYVLYVDVSAVRLPPVFHVTSSAVTFDTCFYYTPQVFLSLKSHVTLDCGFYIYPALVSICREVLN